MNDAANESPAIDPRPVKYRRSTTPKLSPEAARRQGTITRLALEAFGSKEDAIAYLNVEHIQLGGRPIDLATATAEGFTRVEQDLSTIDVATPRSQKTFD